MILFIASENWTLRAENNFLTYFQMDDFCTLELLLFLIHLHFVIIIIQNHPDQLKQVNLESAF